MQVTNQSKRYTCTTYNLQVLELQSVRYTYTTSNFKTKSRNHPILRYADFGVKKINLRGESVRYTTSLQPLTSGFAAYMCVQISYLYLCLY